MTFISEVGQSCPTLCDLMNCSLPGSSVHGVFQARVLEWFAISFSRVSFPPRDRTQISHVLGRRFTIWATREDPWDIHRYSVNGSKLFGPVALFFVVVVFVLMYTYSYMGGVRHRDREEVEGEDKFLLCYRDFWISKLQFWGKIHHWYWYWCLTNYH